MAILLMVCSIPLGLVALSQGATAFYLGRFFIGFAGATFAPCQFWTSVMFTGSIVGQANAMAGGWGNMGGGVTQALMPGIFEIFKAAGASDSNAWRWSLQVPVAIWIIVAIWVWMFSDDCPQGHWRNRIVSQKAPVGCKEVLRVVSNYNVWILMLMYACTFGIELFADNTLAEYFHEEYDIAQFSAGLLASVFGFLNIICRALGGYASDRAAAKAGLRGRMWVIFIMCINCGIFLFIFIFMEALWAAMIILVIFSFWCQAGCGATYGLVPFVDPKYPGVVSGMVGAGGNIGAVCWSLIHKFFGEAGEEKKAVWIVGIVGAAASFAMFLVRIRGATMLPYCGTADGTPAEGMNEPKDIGYDYGYGIDYAYTAPWMVPMPTPDISMYPGMYPGAMQSPYVTPYVYYP